MNGTIPEIIYWLLDTSLGTSRKALSKIYLNKCTIFIVIIYFFIGLL